MTDWTMKRAVEEIESGRAEFLVATTVWSPVKARRRDGVGYLRTVRPANSPG